MNILNPTKQKVFILILVFVLFDILYFLYYKKIIFLHLLTSDFSYFEDILEFQFVLNLIIVPIVFLFATSLIHLTAELFGGQGHFKKFLYQSLFIFIPLTLLLGIMITYFLNVLENQLIWQINKDTDIQSLSLLIRESDTMKIIEFIFILFYILAIFWLMIRVKFNYSVSWFKAIASIISPFTLIYLISLIIEF